MSRLNLAKILVLKNLAAKCDLKNLAFAGYALAFRCQRTGARQRRSPFTCQLEIDKSEVTDDLGTCVEIIETGSQRNVRHTLTAYSLCEDKLIGEARYFQRDDGGNCRDEGSSGRQAHFAQRQSGGVAPAQSGFEDASRYAKEAPLLTSGVCAEAADQGKNLGKMGAGTREAQSSGGRTRASCAQVSGYAGAVGCVGDATRNSGSLHSVSPSLRERETAVGTTMRCRVVETGGSHRAWRRVRNDKLFAVLTH